MKSINTRKIINLAFLFLTIFFLADWFLYATFKISLRGYWSDRILIWLWFLAFVVWIVMIFSYLKTKKLVYRVLFVITAIIITVPIFGALLLFNTGVSLDLDKNFEKYRLRITRSIMARPTMQIAKLNGIFEKDLPSDELSFKVSNEKTIEVSEIEDVKLMREDNDFLYLKIKVADGKWYDVKFPKK